MNRLLTFVLFLLIAFGARADWPLEPKDFRGVAFPGASTAEVAKKLGLREGPGDFSGGCTKILCFDPNFVLADVPMPTGFAFKDDRLVQIFMFFDSSSYGTVKDIVTERYGPPTRVETTPVRTKAGVEYENESVLWTGELVEIKLVRFADSVDKSQWWFYDRAYMAEQAKADDDAKKKAAKSF